MNSHGPTLPTTLDFKPTFLSAFRYVMETGYSTLKHLDWYLDALTDNRSEALVRFQVDLADATGETLLLLGITNGSPEERTNDRKALYGWVLEAGLIDQAAMAEAPLRHRSCCATNVMAPRSAAIQSA